MSQTMHASKMALIGVAATVAVLAAGLNNYGLINLVDDNAPQQTTLSCPNMASDEQRFVENIFTEAEVVELNNNINVDSKARCDNVKDVLTVLKVTHQSVFAERAAIALASGMML